MTKSAISLIENFIFCAVFVIHEVKSLFCSVNVQGVQGIQKFSRYPS